MKEVIVMNKNDKDFLVQKIRTQYTEKENTELDALRELDRKVKVRLMSFPMFSAASAQLSWAQA